MIMLTYLAKYHSFRSPSASSSFHSGLNHVRQGGKIGFIPISRHDKTTEQKVEENVRGEKFIKFINSSPEPFHVVDTVSTTLSNHGFHELDESKPWCTGISSTIQPGGKYYFTRNKSSIVAFIVGKDYKPGNALKIIGAHTDSPNLKIKPNSRRTAVGVVQINVECYGGGIWSSWFDRELSLAGRVMTRNSAGKIMSHLMRIQRPILRIPSLCIHLRSAEERDNMTINKEDHMMPILCDEVKKSLTYTAHDIDDNSTVMSQKYYWRKGQASELLELIANELHIKAEDVVDFELSLYDTQDAGISGLDGEYIVGSRIDNLASCYVALESFIDTSDDAIFSQEINMIALFDHEEVGSGSQPGAGSTLLQDAISRTCRSLHSSTSPFDEELISVSMAKSFIISADMAHAVHPNYASRHDRHHAPVMNGGIVIKTNVNQRYATNGVTGLLVRELGRAAGVPVQEFSVRNDCPCGSTIGPIISASTGIRAVDLGMPQLSMHSIREMMGVSDLTYGYQLFVEFYKNFAKADFTQSKDAI